MRSFRSSLYILFLMFLLLVCSKVAYALPADCSTLIGYNIPESECDILVDLYNNSDGDNWDDNTNWGTGDACDWYGIDCVTISSQDYVSDVVLNNNSLSGTIDLPSLSGLLYIDTLNLSDNNLSGEIAEEWSVWTRINSLDLDDNNFTGDLPSAWSSWTGISWLDLYNNDITGELPSAWSSWGSSISYLEIGSNDLDTILPPSWSSWTNIGNFRAQLAGIKGNLPASWTGMTNLSYLILSNNSLTGSLPEEWSSLTDLVWIFLNDNDLSGTIPTSWSSLTNAEIIYIYGNPDITGELPASWSALSSIQAIGFGGTFSNPATFSGGLPDAWSAWGDTLTAFYLRYTNMVDEIPSSWSAWSGVTDFRVRYNYIYGDTDFAQEWTGLNLFYADNNCYDADTVGSGVTASSTLDVSPQRTCHDFYVTKTANQSGTFNTGDQVGYTLAYGGTGVTNATGSFQLKDYLSSSLSFVSSTMSYTTGSDGSGDYYAWYISNLVPGATGALVFTATVSPGSEGISTVNNEVFLISTGSDLADTGVNNFSSVSINVLGYIQLTASRGGGGGRKSIEWVFIVPDLPDNTGVEEDEMFQQVSGKIVRIDNFKELIYWYISSYIENMELPEKWDVLHGASKQLDKKIMLPGSTLRKYFLKNIKLIVDELLVDL